MSTAATHVVAISGKGRMRTVAGWLFGVTVIGLLIFAVLHFGDLKAFGETLRRAQPAWLLVALLLQGCTYTSVALGWSAVLTKAGAPKPLRRLFPIAISKLFADQMIPIAGMGGNMLLIDRLVALGAPRGAAVAALLVSIVGFYGVYIVLAFAMLGLVWIDGKVTPWIMAFVGIFTLVALAIPGLAIWLRRRGSRPLSPVMEKIPVVRSFLHVAGEAPSALMRDRGLIARVAFLNGLVFLADAATLMVCFQALGQPVSYQTAFIAVIAASMVVTLGPVPLGLGSFEAGSTATLSLLGVPLEAALAATLLLRAFTLWLPLVPGMLLMRAVVAERPKPRLTNYHR